MTVYVTHDGDTWRDIIKNHYGMEMAALSASLTDNENFNFIRYIGNANCFYEGYSSFPSGIKIKLPTMEEIKAV